MHFVGYLYIMECCTQQMEGTDHQSWVLFLEGSVMETFW